MRNWLSGFSSRTGGFKLAIAPTIDCNETKEYYFSVSINCPLHCLKKNQANYIMICAIISTFFFFFLLSCHISYQNKIYIFNNNKINFFHLHLQSRISWLFLHILDDFKMKTNQFSQINDMWTNKEIRLQKFINWYIFKSQSTYDAETLKFCL